MNLDVLNLESEVRGNDFKSGVVGEESGESDNSFEGAVLESEFEAATTFGDQNIDPTIPDGE